MAVKFRFEHLRVPVNLEEDEMMVKGRLELLPPVELEVTSVTASGAVPTKAGKQNWKSWASVKPEEWMMVKGWLNLLPPVVVASVTAIGAVPGAAVKLPTEAGKQNSKSWASVKLEKGELMVKALLERFSLVEVASVTAKSAVPGAAIGAAVGLSAGFLKSSSTSSLIMSPPNAAGLMASLKYAAQVLDGCRVQACNYAILTGANTGISYIMKKLGIEDDFEISFAAGLGSGVLFSLAINSGRPISLPNAVTSGTIFGLVQGGISKMISKSRYEELNYVKTKAMLRNLGLLEYEKIFKKTFITDATLPLLDQSTLTEMKIPAGAKLMILDYTKKESRESKSGSDGL
ncbi:hypothetical protein OROGR_019308 [Orobanche gracilis]